MVGSFKKTLDSLIVPILDYIKDHTDETTAAIEGLTKSGLKNINTSGMQTIMDIIGLITHKGSMASPGHANALINLLTNGFAQNGGGGTANHAGMNGMQTYAALDAISSSITPLTSSASLLMKFIVGNDHLKTEAAAIKTAAHAPVALPAEVALQDGKKAPNFYLTYAEIVARFEQAKRVMVNAASTPEAIIGAAY